eukprot:COSAG05_NODE_429_length_9889_cov_11.904290_2_plen_698_part_00
MYFSQPWAGEQKFPGRMKAAIGAARLAAPLMLAADQGNGPTIRRLLALGADHAEVGNGGPFDGKTALEVAEAAGQEEAAAVLREWAASQQRGEAERQEVERRKIEKLKGEPAEENEWELRDAARAGETAMVRVLLAAGCHPDAASAAGDTPLIVAAGAGHEEVVAMLADAGGADLDLADEHGATPLMQAAVGAHGGVLRQLLGRGAGHTAIGTAGSYEGKTALQLADEYGNEKEAAILRAWLSKHQGRLVAGGVAAHDSVSPAGARMPGVGSASPNAAIPLQEHGLSDSEVAAILRAAGADRLSDLLALDSDGIAETVRCAALKPVPASRLRRALHASAQATAAIEVAPPSAQQLNAQLAKGGFVRLPAGVIEIDRPLLMGVSGTVLEGAGPGVTTLRLKKTGEAIQILSLLYGKVSPDGKTLLRTSGLTVRNLTIDGGQSALVSNKVVDIDQGPSSLDMNCAMGVYASDVLIQNVTFINYYGAITMGALPACQPVGVHTDASGNWRFVVAKGNQPMNTNVRVSGVTTHAVNGSFPGNYGPDKKKKKYAMVSISNGTALTAVIENCTVNDGDYAFNTEEGTETNTHFLNCTAMNSRTNAFELQSNGLQTLTNCVAYSTHRNTALPQRGVFFADTPQGIVAMTNCCSFGSWNCDVFYIQSPYHTLTNCHANGVHVDTGSSEPYSAFRLAPHIIIPGVG